MSVSEKSLTHEHVPCPFCGLLCDDLQIRIANGDIKIIAGGCTRSENGFATTGDDSPRIAGETVTLDLAINHAAELLGNARRPLIGGLETDVRGMRAALALADRIGAALDHTHGENLQRNLRVLQDRGWITTTLSEVRNRADLIVVLGSALFTSFPRLVERIFAPPTTMVDDALQNRRLIVLGGRSDWPVPETQIPLEYIPAPMESMGEIVSVLRCLIDERPIQAATVAGMNIDSLQPLAERIRQASYGVMIWSTGALKGDHPDLTVQCISELITDLNREQRFAGLPLAAGDGDVSAYQACTWQTGYPLRVDLASGKPVYDPYHLSTARALADGADALLWVSSFDTTHEPPDTTVPTVVLGRNGMQMTREPEVFIPVGVPGLNHAGTVFRGDAVVSLPLRQLVDSSLPAAAEVVQAIRTRIESQEVPC
jgi:formylmethanofuran dehydrogenase subunit B